MTLSHQKLLFFCRRWAESSRDAETRARNQVDAAAPPPLHLQTCIFTGWNLSKFPDKQQRLFLPNAIGTLMSGSAFRNSTFNILSEKKADVESLGGGRRKCGAKGVKGSSAPWAGRWSWWSSCRSGGQPQPPVLRSGSRVSEGGEPLLGRQGSAALGAVADPVLHAGLQTQTQEAVKFLGLLKRKAGQVFKPAQRRCVRTWFMGHPR